MSIPKTMRAMRIHAHGDADAMVEDEISVPAVGPTDALVHVAYAGVNFIDIYKRTGVYKVPLPSTIGEEGAGVVVAVGSAVMNVRVGDHVAWAAAVGTYAEYAAVPSARLVNVPERVDLRVAAAVMLQGMTAHYLSTSVYPLKAGDRALVHAAAGGVGLLLVQIAKKRGAFVIGTVGSAGKVALVEHAGADAVINYTTHDFAVEVLQHTARHKLNVVYDSVGKTTYLAGFDLLVPRGMMVLFGQSSGVVPPLDPLILSQKGSLFLTRPTLGHYTATTEELRWRAHDLFEWIGNGSLNVRIDSEYALSKAGDAHNALEGRGTTGKVLINCGGTAG